jgi:alkylhydroperoxidase family enzyme
VEFLRVASGEAALSLSVLNGEDEALPPRAAALARLAATLTAEPWALTPGIVQDVAAHGLGGEQIEAAIGVVAMFNYFTRVADATGIEFDYPSPLPAFRPDRCQLPSARPEGPAPDRTSVGPTLPISRRERRLVAATAAEASGDRDGEADPRTETERILVEFARKLSRHPWTMESADLDTLRACGYSDPAILHVISATAHQNAASRLRTGLATART